MLSAIARAADPDDARAHFERGFSLFGLGRYVEAAAEYERAFELKPDPALLYDAAQSHRLGGNKLRALELYQSYLRLFPKAPNYAEVLRQTSQLKLAIDNDKRVQAAPPVAPIAPKAETAPPPATVAPPPRAAPPAPRRIELTATTPAPARRPRTIRPWVWGVVGGAAAALALGLGLGLGLSTARIDPTPSLATAKVH
jgi:tetratricopeptide (TPR) repeat protein